MSYKSPARHLIDHVAKHEGFQMSPSRTRYEQSIRDAVRIAIEYGLRFCKGDFDGLPLGANDEYFYRLAVANDRYGCQNRSACIAWEHFKGRKPFIYPFGYGDSIGRLATGTRFTWDGRTVEVTSFTADGTALIACSYKNWGQYPRKIERRYRITREQLLEARP